MALLSTDFMAAPGLYGATGQMDKLDISDVLASILLKDTATLGQIPMKGTVHNIEHFWFEDSLNLHTFYAYASTSTSLTINIDDANLSTTAEVLKVFRTNALIMAEGTENILKVIAPSSASVTVSTYSSALWTNLTTTTKFFVVGQPYADELDASDDISKGRNRRKNYTQIFERAIEIAETREHIDLYAVPDELKHQIKARTYEIKRELNMAVIMGGVPESGGLPVVDTGLRTFSGIIQQIRDPYLTFLNPDATVANASDGALTMARINDLCAKMYGLGGLGDDSNCCIIVGPYQARVLALLEEQRIRRSSKELVVGSYANKVITDLGYEMNVVLERWLPADKLLIIDKNAIALMPLKGDSWHMEKMAKTGRRQKFQLSGQYTLRVTNADAKHGLIYGLAYS
jgi:hypothetical protein